MSKNQEDLKKQQQGQNTGELDNRNLQPGTTATANLDKQAHQTPTGGPQDLNQQHLQGQQAGQNQYGQGQNQQDKDRRDRQDQGQDRQEYDTEEEQETPLDYYETLGLKHSASSARIERAYKNLSLRYHPQQYAGQNRAANDTRFTHVSEAYQVLNDPERRRKYDEYLRKNNDKFREYQDKHRQENKVNRRNWRDLHPLHYRHHPYSPFNELYGYQPQNPFEHFNRFLTHGLFDEDDLEFFGFNRNRGHQGLRHQSNRNDYFGDRELRDHYRGNNQRGQQLQHHHQEDHEQHLQSHQGHHDQHLQGYQGHHEHHFEGHQGHHEQHPQGQQVQRGQYQGQYGTPSNQQTAYSQPIEISRSIIKHTRVENGVRTTVTETKKVDADGHVEHLIKEETEDRNGNHKVRFLNYLPDDRRHQITQHQARQPDHHQQAPYNLNQDRNNQDQDRKNQNRNDNDTKNLNQSQRDQEAKNQAQAQQSHAQTGATTQAQAQAQAQTQPQTQAQTKATTAQTQQDKDNQVKTK